MRALRFVIVVCLVLAIGAGVFVFATRPTAIEPIKPPDAASFAPDLIKRGADLAAIGDCRTCHAAPGGRDFAGSRALATPFGMIYSTNITPDAETGIGDWSEAAFRRAMRNGVRRDGSYLYPAFPYDHFTLVSDDDDKALYAYLMTREPARAIAPPNDLRFPFGLRFMLAGWNLLFLREGPYRPDSAHDETWNRGAYLADGLGHCGACHTPRNALGAEKDNEKFAGGEVEGWTAYALNAASPAPVAWNADALLRYLHRGFDDLHGVARGPMAEVAEDLGAASEDDVRAIAVYLASRMTRPGAERQIAPQIEAQTQRGKAVAANSADSQASAMRGTESEEGGLIYADACANCHEGPRAMPFGGIALALSSGITAPRPDNLINIVLYGLPASEAARSPIMPGFADNIDDRQLAALVNFLRARFSDKPPWDDIEKSVQAARSRERAATVRPAPRQYPVPASATQQVEDEAQR